MVYLRRKLKRPPHLPFSNDYLLRDVSHDNEGRGLGFEVTGMVPYQASVCLCGSPFPESCWGRGLAS